MVRRSYLTISVSRRRILASLKEMNFNSPEKMTSGFECFDMEITTWISTWKPEEKGQEEEAELQSYKSYIEGQR